MMGSLGRAQVFALLRVAKRSLRSSDLLEVGEDAQHRLYRCQESFGQVDALCSCSSGCRDANSHGAAGLQSTIRAHARSYRAWTENLGSNCSKVPSTIGDTKSSIVSKSLRSRWGGSWRHFCVETDRQAVPSSSSAGEGGLNTRLEVPELERMLQELSEEASPDSSKIGLITLRLGQEYDVQGAAPDKVLDLANRALTIFETIDRDCVEVGMCLHLIAAVHHKMGQHDQGLGYLERAHEILEKKHSSEFSALKFAVYFLFGDVLTAKGMFDEALAKYCIGISLQETILGAGHLQLGNTYKQVAQAYAQVMQFNEAISYANKALEIHVKHLGMDSVEEAADRRLLSSLYSATEDYAKALEHQLRVQDIVKKNKSGPDDVFADIATSDLQINLGKYDDAIALMKRAQSELIEGSLSHSLACVSLAKAYARKNMMGEAKSLCDMGTSGLSKLDDMDNEGRAGVAQGYSELAAIHEIMNEPTDAIKALQKSLSLSEKVPGQVHAVAGTQAQIGMLLLFSGRVDEALPYMESAAAKLRESLGQNHHALALVLNQLGVANSEVERIPEAVRHFEESKNILLSAYGPGHDDTLAVFQNLVGAYSFLERWGKALESQEHIINEWRKQGQESTSPFREAVENLEWLKSMNGKAEEGDSTPVAEEIRQPHQVTTDGADKPDIQQLDGCSRHS